MKELERTLAKLPKPHIKVENFKRNLRLELAYSIEATRKSTTYRWRFAFATMMAAMLATLLILFVSNPDYPARINGWLTRSSDRPNQVMSSQTPASSEPQRVSSGLKTSNQNRSALLSSPERMEDDREFVRQWYSQHYREQPGQIKLLQERAVLAVREFQLKDGKRILVYRVLDEGEEPGEAGESY